MTDSDGRYVVVSTNPSGDSSAVIHPDKESAEEYLAECLINKPWAKSKVVTHNAFAEKAKADATPGTEG